MTQIFTEDGRLIPVTVIESGPCYVVQKKTVASDGYNAIQLGFSEKPVRLANKPEKGHFKKSSLNPLRILREFRMEDVEAYEVGQVIKADFLQLATS